MATAIALASDQNAATADDRAQNVLRSLGEVLRFNADHPNFISHWETAIRLRVFEVLGCENAFRHTAEAHLACMPVEKLGSVDNLMGCLPLIDIGMRRPISIARLVEWHILAESLTVN
jgi:hypothetical protein